MYYRVAIRTTDTSLWKWKSTPLSSLAGVLGFLRMHRTIAPERLRVFTAPSREEVNAMLARENSGQEVHSVSAAQFLYERGLSSLGTRQEGGEEQEQQRKRTITATLPSLVESRTVEPVAVQGSLSTLERRRIELEMGAGGDHDQPYVFTLPISMPRVLAWMRLLARVQSGELTS